MNIEELRTIVRLLKDEGLSEITISDGDSTITVRQTLGQPGHGPAAPAASPAAPTAAPGPAPEHDGLTVVAPLVGTFYRRPTPEDGPFVELGQTVRAGDTVGVIEAMKVMNEIKAEVAGRIRAVLAEDGAPVEYGQVLFVLDPL